MECFDLRDRERSRGDQGLGPEQTVIFLFKVNFN